MQKTTVLTAAALLLSSCGNGSGPAEERMVPVAVTVAAPSSISETVYAPARLEGASEALIYPAMGGRVEEVLVSEGDSVEAGAPLVRLSTDRQISAGTSAAWAGVSAARASEANALRALERTASLYEAGAVSEQEMETAQVMYQTARAALQQALAGAEQAAGTADNSLVTAPFAGRVVRIWAREGNTAGGGPLVSVTNGSALVARILLPESEIASLSAGLPAWVGVTAYGGESFPGQVTAAARSVDPVSGLVPVEVTFGNPDGRLVPGMSGRIAVTTRSAEGVLVLPDYAFRRSPEGLELALEVDGRARIVPVTTGIVDNGMVEVTSGLAPGDRVIVEGQFRVADGDLVDPVGE